MFICKAYGMEFVAQTEDECWDLVEDYEQDNGTFEYGVRVVESV